MRSARASAAAVSFGFAVSVLLTFTAPAKGQLVFESILGPIFDRPVYVVSPPGNLHDIFILEQHLGVVLIVRDGQLLPHPFLIVPNISMDVQQGLLGMAFHPDFATNGYVYVAYTDATNALVLQRYVSLIPDQAFPDVIMLNLPQPDLDANGGWIGFGPDGFLYVAVGDGQGGPNGDPLGFGQGINNGELYACILRLDVDNGVPYGIPPGNPFLPYAMFDDAIWDFGLRNPWRCSFDRTTGDLWIGDTGWNNAEEVNLHQVGVPGGLNFGWACYDGNFQIGACQPFPAFNAVTLPVHVYDHQGGRCAIVGGYVYRGCSFPAGVVGSYFFGDYCTGEVWRRSPMGGILPVANVGFGLASFGEDGAGELYVCVQTPGAGDVRRLRFATMPEKVDCNENGWLDTCDISAERSEDANGNDIPDECEDCPGPPDGDMNADGMTDGRDIQFFVDAVMAMSTDPADLCHGDFDGSDVMDLPDVPGFVAALLGI